MKYVRFFCSLDRIRCKVHLSKRPLTGIWRPEKVRNIATEHWCEAPPLNLVCGTELPAEVSFILDTFVSKFRSDKEVVCMNNVIYIVGAVVIVLVILSFVGLV